MSKSNVSTMAVGNVSMSQQEVPKIIIGLFWVFAVPFVCLICEIEEGLSWAGAGFYAIALYVTYKQYQYTGKELWKLALYIVCIFGPGVVFSFCTNKEWVQRIIQSIAGG